MRKGFKRVRDGPGVVTWREWGWSPALEAKPRRLERKPARRLWKLYPNRTIYFCFTSYQISLLSTTLPELHNYFIQVWFGFSGFLWAFWTSYINRVSSKLMAAMATNVCVAVLINYILNVCLRSNLIFKARCLMKQLTMIFSRHHV